MPLVLSSARPIAEGMLLQWSEGSESIGDVAAPRHQSERIPPGMVWSAHPLEMAEQA
jgi:hypothetical protein